MPTTTPAGAPAATRRADGRPARLLVVEDERMLADMLLDALSFAGYDAHLAETGSQALSRVGELCPDLLLLDVNMPDFSGFTVAERLRAAGDDTPVIFLTARDAPRDVRDGFLAGGDDYLAKPFRLEELRLRIEAVLRRTMPARAGDGHRLTVADLVLDTESHQVWRGGREVALSRTEFQLLRYLMRNTGRVLSRAELLRTVWNQGFETDTSLVETYISYLRRKLDSGPPHLIHTVRGVGYALREPRP
ncbi:response regulator transcription factor [Phytomonospora sp. NPDC050363]|uniref:response regulator transcription factor n=1 Tax=Phytomonospora sp. NPDC050363 TaxID=3155642 RepID=UPI0033DBA8CE